MLLFIDPSGRFTTDSVLKQVLLIRRAAKFFDSSFVDVLVKKRNKLGSLYDREGDADRVVAGVESQRHQPALVIDLKRILCGFQRIHIFSRAKRDNVQLFSSRRRHKASEKRVLSSEY